MGVWRDEATGVRPTVCGRRARDPYAHSVSCMALRRLAPVNATVIAAGDGGAAALRLAGMLKVAAGVTPLDEVPRSTPR
jgi:hypothetical protein